MYLTKRDILSAADFKSEIVDVPEWGGSVFVREMTGTMRDAFESSLTVGVGKGSKVNTENIRARLVAMCLVDEHGDRLFDDDDIGQLGAKSATALDRVFAVAQRLNAMGERDVEAIAKNSEAAQSGASISD